jgi:hypothetical protein
MSARSRRVGVTVGATLVTGAASLASLSSTLGPTVEAAIEIVALVAAVAGGIYVRRWWYPLALSAPLLVSLPLFMVENDYERGLDLLSVSATQLFFVLLALVGCVIGWIAPAVLTRRPARRP